MKLNIKEKKVLYAFGCTNWRNTVTRLKWLTAMTVDPEAKRWMLALAKKVEQEAEDFWYPEFYFRLRTEMDAYYRRRKKFRCLKGRRDNGNNPQTGV